jgi:hypothetical protein
MPKADKSQKQTKAKSRQKPKADKSRQKQTKAKSSATKPKLSEHFILGMEVSTVDTDQD